MTAIWPEGTALLFDLDGTLVDTAHDLAGTLNDLLAAEGLAPLALEEVRHLVGHGARALLERGFEIHGRTLEAAELDRLTEIFVDHYAGRIARESVPFPGIVAQLHSLKAANCPLGVVTNKREGLARLLLDALDLGPLFGTVFGGDTAPRRKPHPDPILGAIAALGADKARTIMIGDASPDIDAARAAGIQSIAVTFGYNDVPPETLGADALISHFDDLAGAVRKLLG